MCNGEVRGLEEPDSDSDIDAAIKRAVLGRELGDVVSQMETIIDASGADKRDPKIVALQLAAIIDQSQIDEEATTERGKAVLEARQCALNNAVDFYSGDDRASEDEVLGTAEVFAAFLLGE